MLTPQVTSRLTHFVVSSPYPAKKSLLKLVWLALLARFALTLQMTVCSTSDHKEKHVEISTGCYRNKLSEFESLESSDSVQRNEGGSRKTTGQPEEERGRYRNSSVHPDRFPPLFGSGLVVHIFCFSLGRDRSCPVATVHRSNLSALSFCSSTHHDVLECQPITKFLTVELLLFPRSFIFHFLL